MRNLNNWVKSKLIEKAGTLAATTSAMKGERTDSGLSVLDFCCGKGGDLLKWLFSQKGGNFCPIFFLRFFSFNFIMVSIISFVHFAVG